MNEKNGTPSPARVGRRLPALLVAGLVLAGACEGDNLFTGDTAEMQPQVTGMALPQVAFAGDVVGIRVDGSAPRGVSQIVLSLRGAVSMDTTVKLSPPVVRVSQIVSVRIPALLQDTLILVQAALIDQAGGASSTREGTVVVFGPPAVTSLSAPTIVRLGELISVRVSAFGARRIAQIDLVARGAIQKDTSIAITPARSSVTQDIVLRMPGSAQDTLVTLSVGARDEVGQGSEPVSRTIPIVIEPPAVTLIAPALANAGLDLDVSVHARAVRQVSQVRLELRGAYVKDVSITLSPTQSDVVQNISVPLPGNLVTSPLRVRAAAVDRGGVVAYSSESTVAIPLGPPQVTDVEVPFTALSNRTVDVRVRARGDRPLSRIEVRFRGATDALKTFDVDPKRTEVIQDAFVTIPASPIDSVLVVMATAIDLSGAVSEIMSKAIPVTITAPAPEPEPEPQALSFAGARSTGATALRRGWLVLEPALVPAEHPFAATRQRWVSRP